MLYTLQPGSLPARARARAASCGYHYIYLSTYLRFVVTPSSGSSSPSPSLPSFPSLPLSFSLSLAPRCLPRTARSVLSLLGRSIGQTRFRLIETPGHRSGDIGAPMADRLHFTPPMDFTGVPTYLSTCLRYCDGTAPLTPMKAL